MTKLCVKELHVTKLCVTKLCVKELYVTKLCVTKLCVSQPSAVSATPATQSEGRCHEVPRLPHKVKVDVTKCHACHAKHVTR